MNDALALGLVLERLMKRYGDNLRRMCYMMLRDRELAREAALAALRVGR